MHFIQGNKLYERKLVNDQSNHNITIYQKKPKLNVIGKEMCTLWREGQIVI
jgi:hypothetical protein